MKAAVQSCTFICKRGIVPVNLFLYALIVDRLGMLHQVLGNEPAHLHVFSIVNTSVNVDAARIKGLVVGGRHCSATTSMHKIRKTCTSCRTAVYQKVDCC